jgi:hypothetical protein
VRLEGAAAHGPPARYFNAGAVAHFHGIIAFHHLVKRADSMKSLPGRLLNHRLGLGLGSDGL